MKPTRTNKIILFLIVLAMGMASASCDQPTGDQMQVQEEKSVTEAAASFDATARLPGFDTKARKCTDAVYEMFLKLGDIEGGAEDTDHEGQIEIFSWIWGASGRATSSHSGRGKGRANVSVQPFGVNKWIDQPFVITKPIDKASPELRRYADSGESIAEAVFTIRMTCGEEEVETETLTIVLEDVVISSYQSAGSSPRFTTEEVAIGCKKSCGKVEYTWKIEEG